MRRQYLLLLMGLGPSASRPSGHNTKRSATAGRFFICRINPRGAGAVLKTEWLPMAAGVRVLYSAPYTAWEPVRLIGRTRDTRVRVPYGLPCCVFYMLHSQLQTGPDQSMRQGRCVPQATARQRCKTYVQYQQIAASLCCTQLAKACKFVTRFKI